MLSVLADTSLTGGDVTAVLAGLGETGRHCRGCLANWRRAPWCCCWLLVARSKAEKRSRRKFIIRLGIVRACVWWMWLVQTSPCGGAAKNRASSKWTRYIAVASRARDHLREGSPACCPPYFTSQSAGGLLHLWNTHSKRPISSMYCSIRLGTHVCHWSGVCCEVASTEVHRDIGTAGAARSCTK